MYIVQDSQGAPASEMTCFVSDVALNSTHSLTTEQATYAHCLCHQAVYFGTCGRM